MSSTATISEEAATRPTPAVQREGARIAVLDVATLGIACVVFLGLCLYQLDLPGLYNDEAFDVIPAMQMVLGQPVEVFPGAELELFGLTLPLMSSSSYQGATSTYLVLPFFALGGVSVFTLRLMTVLVGVVAIIVTFFLARSWFGPAEARLVALMMAVSPAWVFWSRLGVYVVSPIVPIAGGALLALTAWARRRPLGRRNAPLYLGAFLLGLGLSTKLLFIWYIVALGLVAFILWGRPILERRRQLWSEAGSWLRVVLGAAAAFCIGAFPFLLYNLMTRGTYYTIRENLFTTTHGVDNTAFMRNLWGQADAFKVLLDGGYFWFQGVLGRAYANPLTPALFALSAVGLVAFILARRGGKLNLGRPLRTGTGLLFAAFTLSALLAVGIVPDVWADAAIVAAAFLGAVGAAFLVVFAFRSPNNTATAGWMLLAYTVAAGSVWWFAGAGRPEGPAPGALLGLWPVDASGILFWVAGVGLTVVLGSDRQPAPYQRATIATLAIIGLIVAQSSVTVSGLWSTHLLVMLPLPQLVIAAFAVRLGREIARWKGSAGLSVWRGARALPAVLLVGSIVTADLIVDYSYHRDLTLSGGGSTFSDAIYSLADYLEEQGRPVVAMDWGFRRPVQFLTHDRVDPVEAYGISQEPPPQFYDNLKALLAEPDTLYLFHTREGSAYPRHDAFFSEVRAAGKEAVLERTFYHRDGLPVYEVYSVR